MRESEAVATTKRIISFYREQLRKLKGLSVYNDDGQFISGGTTEHGTVVTENLIAITQKRMMELINQNLNRREIKPVENYTNGQAK